MLKCRHLFRLSLLSLACTSAAFAATPMPLQYQSATHLQSINGSSALKETSRHVDRHGVTHIRVQQTYKNIPVWNGDVIIHVPQNQPTSLAQLNAKSTVNGFLYQKLDQDLGNVPTYLLNAAQAEKAFQHGLGLHQSQTGIKKYDAKHIKKDLMIYVDQENKAHYAYFISFISGLTDGTPAVPTYILDATTFKVYESWNNLQTISGGGFGGNPKMGKLVYDGLNNNRPILNISRSDQKRLCTIENESVVVKDDTDSMGPISFSPVASFQCNEADSTHNNVFWDGDLDATRGAYSPVNDSMYAGMMINELYQNWYHVPVLSNVSKLVMHAHAKDLFGQPMDNAYFLSFTSEMYFGDGVKLFYPLTSLGVGAHELSHGFTSEHSNLTYEKQSGGLNESYSDMAAQAAEYYAYGTNSWQIGPEIVIGDGALRYMDQPTKDGKSIDCMHNYNDQLNVHYSSGLFNKAFYLLATSSGWNTKKAFDVMVKANMDYWRSSSTFEDAAAGVMKAAEDYQYDTKAVKTSLMNVGLMGGACKA